MTVSQARLRAMHKIASLGWDIDAYIAQGGRIEDLPTLDMDAIKYSEPPLPDALIRALVLFSRIEARFYKNGKPRPKEKDLRDIWNQVRTEPIEKLRTEKLTPTGADPTGILYSVSGNRKG